MELMHSNLSLNKEELVRAACKIFGFAKVGSQIDAVVKVLCGGFGWERTVEGG